MLSEIFPPDFIKKFDETMVFTDDMELFPTDVAIRGMYYNDLLQRNSGIKPPGVLPNPLTAQIEFTQLCNQQCVFCYNNSGPNNPDELSLDTLGRVCNELLDMNVVELILSGGEPLTRRKHLQRIFDIVGGSGTPIHLLTNGILLTDNTLQWLKRNNVKTIQVSIDGGDPDAHDRQRRMKGAWLRTMAALVRAHEHGFFTIVSCTLTRDNADSVGEFIDYCYLAGADWVNIGDLITWGRAEDWMQNGACTNDQYDDVAKTIIEKRRKYGESMRITLAVSMLYFICKIHLLGQENMLIRGNGDVLPHCTLSGIVNGNVSENSLRDIWDNSLSVVSEDPRLMHILEDHEVVRTEKMQQLRCFRRTRA